MDLASFGELTGIGLVGGFMAGFLGIGGGIVIIPLLLYGLGVSMKLATGISMFQAFFATLSGVVIHRRNRTVNTRLGVTLGLSGVVGGIVGAVGAAQMSSRLLLGLYLLLVLLSLTLLLFAPRKEKSHEVVVSMRLALPIGLGVGILAGMLGVGGGVVLIPLMISVLRIPTKVAVGTSLVVILMTTLAGAAGKIATGQVDLQIAAFVIAGSIAGAQLGGRVNSRVSPRVVRVSLSLLLIGIVIRTGLDLITT